MPPSVIEIGGVHIQEEFNVIPKVDFNIRSQRLKQDNINSHFSGYSGVFRFRCRWCHLYKLGFHFET